MKRLKPTWSVCGQFFCMPRGGGQTNGDLHRLHRLSVALRSCIFADWHFNCLPNKSLQKEHDMVDIPNEAGRRVHAMSNRLHEAGDEAKRMAQEGIGHLRGTMSQYYQHGRERLGHVGEVVEHQIEERPVTSLLIAAACGFVVGMLIARR
jgi:ElaB/YqjD/DUF883 family membrane-anchored ribosome-binding protein